MAHKKIERKKELDLSLIHIYSDGSSASGVSIKIKDAKGDVLRELKLDSNSEVSFPKPEGDYKVMFDGGEGHSIELDGKKIVQ